MEIVWGATLGKYATSLKVMAIDNHSSINWQAALKRNLILLLMALGLVVYDTYTQYSQNMLLTLPNNNPQFGFASWEFWFWERVLSFSLLVISIFYLINTAWILLTQPPQTLSDLWAKTVVVAREKT